MRHVLIVSDLISCSGLIPTPRDDNKPGHTASARAALAPAPKILVSEYSATTKATGRNRSIATGATQLRARRFPRPGLDDGIQRLIAASPVAGDGVLPL